MIVVNDEREGKFVQVRFCADGGQTCEPGVRSFENSEEGRREAVDFAWKMEEEPGHYCSHSVKIGFSNEKLSEGAIFPAVADSNPPDPDITTIMRIRRLLHL